MSKLIAVLVCYLLFLVPVQAQTGLEQKPPVSAGSVPLAQLPLDELFSRLARTDSEKAATSLAAQIEKRWSRSGSDTADLLMERAGQAMAKDDPALAVELADRALALAPDWAEGWSRKALALYTLEDQAGAIVNLGKALSFEPRHYVSLMALGHIFAGSENPRQALAAYRKAKELHPFLEDVDTKIRNLALKVDGQDL